MYKNHQWCKDESPEFKTLWSEFRGTSLLHPAKAQMLHDFIRQAASLEGSAAEVGVYKGGSAGMIATLLKHKTVHLFDSFEGMPEPGEKDCLNKGDFSDVTGKIVQHALREHANIEWHIGWFPDTAEGIDDRFCFVHIDCDFYEPVKACCEFFYQRMVAGGIMFFDDYGFEGTPGAKDAVDEFLYNKSEYPIYIKPQCVAIKI